MRIFLILHHDGYVSFISVFLMVSVVEARHILMCACVRVNVHKHTYAYAGMQNHKMYMYTKLASSGAQYQKISLVFSNRTYDQN
jgi:hypothetical protein